MSTADRAAREARAAARRASLVLHKARLGEAERDFSPVTGAEAITLANRLTRECWAMLGEPIPALDRSAIPVRFVRWNELRREGGLGNDR